MTAQTPMQPILSLSNVRFGWPGESNLLDIERFELAPGERVFLHGPSGSGKSTLLGLIAGIHLPQAGHIHLHGQDLVALSASRRDRIRGSEIGYVFQQFNLVPYLSVLENVLLPLTFSSVRRARTAADGVPAAQALKLMQALGLAAELAGRSPGKLSVGQQQRVAVARALLGHPPLVICDEPTSALDTQARDDFLELLIASVEASNAALIFVSHDPGLADHFSRQLRLQGGGLVPA
jgi:putative ABC transport system ATP-binding protein